MADLTFYMNILKETETIKQAAIINFEGDMIIKTDAFEVEDVELEPFGCLFQYNTQVRKEEIRLNNKVYQTTEAEEHFLYGKCKDKALMVIQSDQYFIIVLIDGDDATYKTTRLALENISARMRSFGL